MRQAYDYWQDQPGFCVPSAACEARVGAHKSQTASAQGVCQRTNQHRHKSNAPTCGLPFQKQRQSTRRAECTLRCSDLAWKASANAADFTDRNLPSRLQIHKPEPFTHRSTLPSATALLTTRNRSRMGWQEGRRPVNRSLSHVNKLLGSSCAQARTEAQNAPFYTPWLRRSVEKCTFKASRVARKTVSGLGLVKSQAPGHKSLRRLLRRSLRRLICSVKTPKTIVERQHPPEGWRNLTVLSPNVCFSPTKNIFF